MERNDQPVSRRSFLGSVGSAIGSAAFASTLVHGPDDVPTCHYRPRVRRVIHLCMAGGPSHLETFDFKPELAKLHGKAMPKSFTAGQQIAQLQGKALKALGPQHPFRRWGRSGQEISTVLPHIGSIADQICIIRSMQTDQINHDPAHTLMNTGSAIQGRPSMGSWVLQGLGSQCNDLPGFVVMVSVGGAQDQPIAARQWSSGFLPSGLQGVEFQTRGAVVEYLERPPGIDAGRQRDVVDAVNELSRLRHGVVGDPELTTSISQMEMAYRMQRSVPALMNIGDESPETLDLYGVKSLDGTFAANCLMARRLVERGVRFIQLYHRGWDHHGGVKNGVARTAGYVDRASAALVKDLSRRGLLDDTLVIWGGEFGRTPMGQGSGRDHHIRGFSTWLAGGGIRGGHSYGATDELGYHAVEDIVTVHDLHATMLHLLGIDHLRLTYRYQGRDFRLTDIAGQVVTGILA
ncbi:MAG: sulfatase [Planctomycetes bacterium]|nr:sulfatase [Planctomycetota bacterium]